MSIKRIMTFPHNRAHLETNAKRDKEGYESQITDILCLWDQTIISISDSNQSNITKKRLLVLHAEWKKLSDEIIDIDMAIRLEVNKQFVYSYRFLEYSDLTTAFLFTKNEKYEFECSETQVPFDLQESTFKILRLCSVLNRKIIKIMEFLQRVKEELCGIKSTTTIESLFQNENQTDDIADRIFIASCLDEVKKEIIHVSEKVDNRNRKEKCKPISQKRCAELIVDELEETFPRINVTAVKRMLSDWDTGKRESVKGYSHVKQLADEQLFRKWASNYFRYYYSNERRGKYIRTRITHNEHDLDQHAFSKHKQQE